jgi:F0F1-type ATP synthase delta subunit
MTFSFTKRIAASFFGLVLLIHPLFAQDASSSSKSKSSVSISTDSRDNIHRWKTSRGFDNFNVEYRGKIEITDDDKDIKSMSNDGYLEISKTVFGSKRSLVIESQGDGKLKKEYYEGRTPVNWDPNGKAWLAEILPEVVRTTTLCAESRVSRFFKQGGTSAVLNEMDKIESDYVRSHYANVLMKQPVQAKDYSAIINKLAEKTDSDHYMTEFLKNNTDKFLQNKEAATALFSATRKMDSDHYKTVVIKQALNGQMTSLENVKIILQAAGQMESDHYITEVLTSLLKQNNLTDGIVSEIINTTGSIESDHYKTVVLTQAMEKSGLSATSYSRVVESVKTIESDHYITQVLGNLLETKLTDDVLNTLLTILPSIESDHYKTQVFTSLFKRQDLKEEQFDKLMPAFERMDSDHYKTQVLTQFLTSDNSEARLIKVLQMANTIDSDHYITEVLVRAAPRVKSGSAAAKEAYRSAARNISSETYYGRALRAVE